jgi:beta-mannanase
MRRHTSRVLLAAVAAALAVPSAMASPGKVASAQTSDGAIIGVVAGWNLDANDASLGPDIGTVDSCTAGAAPPGYVKDMNDWQGKHNTVIEFYYGFDQSANYFAYSNPCNNSQYVPWIWNNYDAVPMQVAQLAPPESVTACADGTTNPYACFSDGNSTAVSDNAVLQTFGQTLNRWLNSADAYGNPPPPGGRRYYIRLNWESNGTWVPWGPAYATLSGDTYVPVYADNCADLFRQEMFNVAWWRYMRNTVDSYIHPISGTVSDEVNWVYSQFAYSPLTLTNPVTGQPYFPASVQNCPPQTNTVYSTTQPVYPSDLIEAMYPGDDTADWTGLDGYGTCGPTSLSLPSPSTVFSSYVSDLHSFTTKPVSIDEVGAAIRYDGAPCSTTTAKAAWVQQYLSLVQSANVRMSIWFNDDENSADGGVDDDAVFCNAGADAECLGNGIYTGSETGVPTPYIVYKEYQQGLQSTWFETPDASQSTSVNGRVMDDATFQGSW